MTMRADTMSLLRSIPAMEELLNADWAGEFLNVLGREQVKTIITEVLDGIRREICGGLPLETPVGELAAKRSLALLRSKSAGTLKPVVNATGVVIHTNLGRAPLAGEALRAVNAISGTYSTLEYSPEKCGRLGRGAHVEEGLCRICGAEAALVVNNNAAAVLLALSAMAQGREVIVSAGELVEIGDSFRIPEILSFSGAKMKAVGCTNSTRIEDYSGAITENTAVLLKVHPSNYKISGFVKTTSREELAALASSRGLLFMEDLGSGLLCPAGADFASREPTVRACLEAGSGIVTFSGDKLLGGPQIGVIAGSKGIIDRIKRHQLLRALRVDKMTLAAFDATLRLYLSGRRREIPVIRMIEADKGLLLERAGRLRRMLKRLAEVSSAGDFTISVVETEDAVGGGAFPTDTLPGYGVALRSLSVDAEVLAAGLRAAPVPVIPAIREGRVVLHARTLLAGDEKRIASAFALCLGGGAG
ncbi:MAG: L-seryl-tRNA(Sec) selenium transferase [Spirochaetaceae bacterium]|jgi:L-seryl-tRNA(Ser) seleniumtransferase|nr:L-seryl-tRNA(Sec) selenium transferase [Spirochaetaceae bacterium]